MDMHHPGNVMGNHPTLVSPAPSAVHTLPCIRHTSMPRLPAGGANTPLAVTSLSCYCKQQHYTQTSPHSRHLYLRRSHGQRQLCLLIWMIFTAPCPQQQEHGKWNRFVLWRATRRRHQKELAANYFKKWISQYLLLKQKKYPNVFCRSVLQHCMDGFPGYTSHATMGSRVFGSGKHIC